MPKWLNPRSWYGLILVPTDAVMLYLAIGIVHYLRLDYWYRDFDWQLGAIVVVVLTSLYVFNVYYLDRTGQAARTALRAFAAVAVSGAMIASVVYVTKSTDVSTVLWRGNLPLGLFVFALYAALVRFLGQSLITRFSREPRWLVFGNGQRTGQLVADIRQSPSGGEAILLDSIRDDPESVVITANTAGLRVSREGEALFEGRVEGIVVAADQGLPDSVVSQLMRVRLGGTPIMDVADFYEQYLFRVPVLQLRDGWFAMSEGFALLHHDIQLKAKRLIDLAAASIGLVVLSPLLVIVAVLVRVTSPGPAIYSQTRTGYGGRPFQLRKFRTMVKDAEKDGPQWTSTDDPRITALGNMLRKTRVDELPQLWNVLIGDMSFIGPRPERPDFNKTLEAQIPYYDLRHLVKPGVTGWAQVMYTYGASVDDAKNKLEFDLYYIKNYSLALDMYIALRTVRVVFSWAGR